MMGGTDKMKDLFKQPAKPKCASADIPRPGPPEPHTESEANVGWPIQPKNHGALADRIRFTV